MSEHAFDYAKLHRSTKLPMLSGGELHFEAGFSQAANDDGVIKMHDPKTKATYLLKVADLIANLMALSGEKEARYMNDGLFSKSKHKSVIAYNFYARASRMYMAGEMIRCTVELEVPDELREAKVVNRKHIVHSKNNTVLAPSNAGQLPSGAPKLSEIKL